MTGTDLLNEIRRQVVVEVMDLLRHNEIRKSTPNEQIFEILGI